MGINSCIYETLIMHCRVRPKRHQFIHRIFMFYLDLDEIEMLTHRLFFFKRNKRAVYSFRDDDHFEKNNTTVKEKLRRFLQEKGINIDLGKVMLLTNLRTWGHLFNPVSFYFCFDASGNPLCIVPEIGNTFGEIKPFLIGLETQQGKKFVSRQKKYFYISPFVDLDAEMEFRIYMPAEHLNIAIDDYDKEGRFIYTTMSGRRVALNNRNLFWYTLRFPFITLKVIFLIHFHALLLWLKGIPYHQKHSNLHLQKEVSRVRPQDRQREKDLIR